MQPLEIGMPSTKGFTLIELLVVLLIVGITLKMAFLAYDNMNAERQILHEATLFKQKLETLRTQALLEGIPLTVKITPQGYTVFRAQHVLQTQSFSKALYLTFPSETQAVLWISISAEGEWTPFSLLMGSTTQPALCKLMGSTTQLTLIRLTSHALD